MEGLWKKDCAQKKQLEAAKPKKLPGGTDQFAKEQCASLDLSWKRLRTFPSLSLVRGTSRSFLSENNSAGVGGTYYAATHQHDARTQTRVTDVWPGPTRRNPAVGLVARDDTAGPGAETEIYFFHY